MILDRKNLTARSAFRSVRYRTTRQGACGTADPSASPFFRIKKHSMLQTTMEGTKPIDSKFSQTVRVKPLNNEKVSYIESFNSLMNPQQHRPNSEQRKFEILDFRKESRMFFKNFQQLNDSQFTTLDQIKKPITFVKMKAHEAEKQLKKQNNEVQHLKLQLEILKNNKLEQLSSIEKQFSDHIAIIKGAIRQNQINQQQIKLRTKREIEGLETSVQQLKQTFNEIHDRNLDMQSTIFNCQPFQLAQKQQFSQSYREAGDYF